MNNRGFGDFSDMNDKISKFVKRVSGSPKNPSARAAMTGGVFAVGLAGLALGMFFQVNSLQIMCFFQFLTPCTFL